MQKQKGFTIIELIVVIAIMGVISTLFLVNYNGQRGPRNLKLAQNLLVTNIRKTQSYILSAKTINSNLTARYYQVRIDKNSNRYLIYGLDTTNTAYLVETVNLPSGVTVSNIQYSPVGGNPGNPSYALISFSSPYSKTYTYTSEDTCTNYTDPSCLLSISDRLVTITLREAGTGGTKTVIVSGLTGKVEGP